MNNNGEVFECGMRVHPFEDFEATHEGHIEIENNNERPWTGMVVVVRRFAGKVIERFLAVGNETEFIGQASFGEEAPEKENFI